MFKKFLIIVFIGLIAFIVFEGGFYLGFLKGPVINNNTKNTILNSKPLKLFIQPQDYTLSKEEKIYKTNLLLSRDIQDKLPANLIQKITTQINIKGIVTEPITNINENVNSFVITAINSNSSYRMNLTKNMGQEVHIFKKTCEKGNPVETTIAEIKNGSIIEVIITFDILSTKRTLYNLTIIE